MMGLEWAKNTPLHRPVAAIGGRVARGLTLGAGNAASWQTRFRRAAAKNGAATVLRTHPRYAVLAETGFCVGAYLEKNGDVADAVTCPGEAVQHYLLFGYAEGRDAHPDNWNPAFLRARYGLDVAAELPAHRALRLVSDSGVDPHQIALTEAQYWLLHGVHGPTLAPVFEHEIYWALADQAGHQPPDTDRLGCIQHFCTIGLDKGLPAHPALRFDRGYYTAALAARGLQAGSVAPYQHWARTGLRHGAHCNPKAHIWLTIGVEAPDALIAALPDVARATPSLGPEAPLPDVVDRFLTAPLPGLRALDLRNTNLVSVLLDLARHLRRTDAVEMAEGVLRAVLAAAPHMPAARVALADVIHDQTRIGEEIELRSLVPADFDTGANGVTLAERLLDAQRVEEALEVVKALPPTIEADVTLRARRLAVGRRAFDMLWRDLPGWCRTHGVHGTQQLLSWALAALTPPLSPPQRSAPIRRVALFASADLPQCKDYRAAQKQDQLRQKGRVADLYIQGRDEARLRARLDQYDAVIFVRVAAFPDTVDLIADAVHQGLATFYDMDDLIFDAEVFPPPLDSYAGRITADEHRAIACGVPLFRHALALCDTGLASTPALQATMAPHVRTGQVYLHRNGLGAGHMQAIRTAQSDQSGSDGPVTLFYGSGTKAHKAIFHAVLEPALQSLVQRFPDRVRVRLMGAFDDLRHLDPTHPAVEVLDPNWSFEPYCATLSEADINLSILEDCPVADAKSEIKWMEAAMFGIPSVLSPTATHLGVVEDGKTAVLASDEASILAALTELIDAPDTRRQIGAAARAQVMERYGLAALGQNLIDIFDQVRPPTQHRKTRLLILHVFYPPQDIGGATRVVQDTVRDLCRCYGDRFEVDVITTLQGAETPYEVGCYSQDGARIWTIGAAPGIDTMAAHDPQMADVVDRLLDRIAPDLVHVHCVQRLTSAAVQAVRRRDIPYLISLHDGWWVSPNQFVTGPGGQEELYQFDAKTLPARAQQLAPILHDAQALLAVSERFAALHRGAGLPQVQCLENATRPSAVAASGPRHRTGRLRVGHIGGASRHKGYALLRAAIETQDLPNLDLTIVDHALPPGQVRRQMWGKTSVRFLPRRPLAEMDALYAELDVVIAPSTWPESYGLVTREARQAGLWVIASDRGAIGDGVEPGKTGFVVPVDDHRALADCLAKLNAAPATYQARLTHPPTGGLSPEAYVDRLVAQYDRILGRPVSCQKTNSDPSKSSNWVSRSQMVFPPPVSIRT